MTMSSSRRKTVVRTGDVATELAAYEARIIAAGGTIAAASLAAVGDFIQFAKANGFWDKLVDVGPFAGNQLAAALVKLKYPTGVQTGLTNVNFISGDYTEATGLNPNGTTKYLKTGATIQDHIGSAYGTLAVYARAAAPTDALRTALGEHTVYLASFTDSPVFAFDWNTAETLLQPYELMTQAGAAGFYAGSVEQPEQILRAYYNGSLAGTGSTAGASNDQEVYVFAGNNGSGTPERFWTGRLSFYALATWLTAAEHAALYTAVQALQTALGRNV